MSKFNKNIDTISWEGKGWYLLCTDRLRRSYWVRITAEEAIVSFGIVERFETEPNKASVKELEMSLKEQLKEYIQEHYDCITSISIAAINQEYGFRCTISECVEIRKELFPD